MAMALLIIGLVLAAHFSRQRGDNLLALGFVGLALLFFVPSWPQALWSLIQAIPGYLPAGLIGNLAILALAIFGLRYIFSLNRN